jgi:hypothetical protein
LVTSAEVALFLVILSEAKDLIALPNRMLAEVP